MIIKDWNIESMTGYKPLTTFYSDFSIADNFGIEAVKDTFKRAFNEWKNDYKYLTELSLVLNWKAWEHEMDYELCNYYTETWQQVEDYCFKNLKGNELDYYIKTTD